MMVVLVMTMMILLNMRLRSDYICFLSLIFGQVPTFFQSAILTCRFNNFLCRTTVEIDERQKDYPN